MEILDITRRKTVDDLKDITLTHLGKMHFLMSMEGDGCDIMYIKKKDFIELDSLDKYKAVCPTNYYCKHTVKLSAFDAMMGIELDQKIAIKTGELRKWLIEQDRIMGEILSSRRQVKL